MGIFSDSCPNPDCSAQVKKAAKFCSHCGWAGGNSLSKCSDCHKQVGSASLYCWNCGADNRTPPPRIVNGRWIRDDDEIAVRVGKADVEGFLSQKVAVERGTAGVIEQTRKLISPDKWKEHTVDSIFKLGVPKGLVLIAETDTILRPTLRSLRDRNGAAFDMTLQVALRVADYDAFVKTFFDGRSRRVTHRMREERLSNELLDGVRSLVLGSSLEEIYGNIAWRNELEQNLRDAMSVTLTRSGLELIQLNFVEMGGDHYEELQQNKGEVYMGNHAADVLAEKIAIRKRVMDLNVDGKLAEHSAKGDLEEKVDELNTQYGLRKTLRDTDRDETVAQAIHELALKDQLRGFETQELEKAQDRKSEEDQLVWDLEVKKLLLLARNENVATENDFEREQSKLNNASVLEIEWDRSEQARRNVAGDSELRYKDIVASARANADAQTIQLEADLKQLEHDNLSEDAKLDRQIKLESHLAEVRRGDKRLEQEELKLILDYKRDKAALNADKDRAVAEAISSEKDKHIDMLKDAQGETNAAYKEGLKTASQVSANVYRGGSTFGMGTGSEDMAPCPKCMKPVPVVMARCPHCDKLIIE